MKRETKYDIGDKVWRLSGYPEEPEKVTIIGCRLGYRDDYAEYMGEQSAFYSIEGSAIEHEERELFPTKEELLKSL